ncbi:MAG: class I SAM-dependent methyltransferase [Ignavibacteriales bacterium]|nr:class I SAM-dependent methyltransferase [Ignavibacteriales bacterium]
MKKIKLRKGREKSINRKHPWIFSGAIEREDKNMQMGETCEVFSFNDKLLGHGAYSPNSQIRVRMWNFIQEEKIDNNFFLSKIIYANEFRNELFQRRTNAYRVFNSESDGIPGLIVDKYNDFLVVQFLSAGAEFWKNEIIRILISNFNPKGIYERSDSSVMKLEGLEIKCGVVYGDEPPEYVIIDEGQFKFLVDIKNGHKTGFYLDQKINRNILSKYSKDKEVLNCFSYTGGFTIAALKGGAKIITNLDSSKSCLDVINKNIELNSLEKNKSENIECDVFHKLREYRDIDKKFDLIILDPPKFIDSKANLISAARGYKDINYYAFQLLRNGGVLFTFSCSGLLSTELFQKIVFDACLDAVREGIILENLYQSPDHTISLNFPEARYLKGLVVKVL